MTGQLTTTAAFVEFLHDQDGEWFTKHDVVDTTSLSQSSVERDLRGLREKDKIEYREGDYPNQPGPDPMEYRFEV